MVGDEGFVPQTPETAADRKPNRWLPKSASRFSAIRIP